MSELRKTEFAQNVRAIALGSRKNLCINETIRNGAGGIEGLNDRCLDAQTASELVQNVVSASLSVAYPFIYQHQSTNAHIYPTNLTSTNLYNSEIRHMPSFVILKI